MQSKYHKLKKYFLPAEIAAFLTALFASFVELAHIAQSGWMKVFLFNSDSLTLPIIRQSLARKEAIMWVFSSQLNLFPEGILYAISSMFSCSISTSLAINGVLNILIFYVLVRAIMTTYANVQPVYQRAYSLLAVFILIGYMLLETYNLHFQAMASYFTFTTYYGGVLICCLLTLYAMLRQLRSAASMFAYKNLVICAGITLLVTLTTASNPLYVLQVAVPLLAALVVSYFVGLLTRQKLILLGIGQLLGAALGMVARLFLGSYIGQSLQAHSSMYNASVWGRIRGALSSLIPANQTLSIKMRIFITALLYLITLFYVLWNLRKKLKQKDHPLDPAAYLVLLFIVIEPLFIVILVSIVNGMQPRYLITPILLSSLGVVTVLTQINHAIFKRTVVRAVIITSVIVVVAGALSIPRTKPLVGAAFPDTSCLSAALDHTPAVGLAGYWTARALDVYSQDNIRVLQAGSFKPFAWLNNLASYQGKSFTFILKDTNTSIPPGAPSVLTTEDEEGLGQPSKITHCPRFDILQYAPGTQGYKLMNQSLQASVAKQIALRSQGKIAEYTHRKNKDK